MAEPVKKAFVIGHPIAHSRSPKIHGHWLAAHGIAGSYEAIDVAPADLAAFLAGLRKNGFSGGNVTLPHKEAVFTGAGRRDEAAELIGAVNTLWFEDGILVGGNTDAYGLAADLDEYAPGWASDGPAVVLGAGGASRAVIYALKARGVTDIRIANRTLARAEELRDRFGAGITAHPLEAVPDLLGDAGLLVNTTSVGMAGKGKEELPARSGASAEPCRRHRHRLRAAGDAAVGCRARSWAEDGGWLGMLLHQAVPGFERWFGIRPRVTRELRALIVADLGAAA